MNFLHKKHLGYADVVIYDNDIFHTHILSGIPLTLSQVIEISEFRNSFLKTEKP
jgi:hypothetical protein